MIGLIGGSGLYGIPGFEVSERRRVETPYGLPSDDFLIGELSGRPVAFLPRHSSRHNIPPHKVNYRANIRGFRDLGAERVIAVSAVGGINSGLRPGEIVLLSQIIDFTKSRVNTFYDGDDVVHVDFTEPYCPELRESLVRASESVGISLRDSGTYVCVEGPRLETAAEIAFFSSMGADVVGMTGMPEAVLARESELCYAALAVVTNLAAGISPARLTTREVVETMNRSAGDVNALLTAAVGLIPPSRGCRCGEALKDAGM
ncbi:MAG: S-methyl-5'-thioadenosine phosphorylase [Nitrospirae bacterium]|nr:S-methyl-5'-thioadenosine phosphorylase [Nitrospirota bacterium]